MLFTLAIGILFGGAAATLLRQWRDGALVPSQIGRLPQRPTLDAAVSRSGRVFVPHAQGRRAA
jgi:hypothetical protein